jgi:hypothetical protein
MVGVRGATGISKKDTCLREIKIDSRISRVYIQFRVLAISLGGFSGGVRLFAGIPIYLSSQDATVSNGHFFTQPERVFEKETHVKAERSGAEWQHKRDKKKTTSLQMLTQGAEYNRVRSIRPKIV